MQYRETIHVQIYGHPVFEVKDLVEAYDELGIDKPEELIWESYQHGRVKQTILEGIGSIIVMNH